ncbi:DNA-binding XRE family transcriptional regulator [Lachnospiraceae bacterium PF1-21]|uniref:Helix-turn-helix domain-containing protein n=1 Tax=Ohessyouella blattaphilus TaxID=2949333 RepID=A0ABT1ELE8_9FIRM|nr:helix-turn-helix transcriptional regulator [Ohessyouella blattaphilus]MCP1111351.1 helix-turn-helix domain-containing protein [Ohessyouella blattaphilus]MCR8564745.1 helix-turn-helix domain-containing protein [Ohessyouella blattaphilus]MDL2250721.1 helix-turn-helix domain-containing protein [Lachnospiraceae bacterium OttesenSCG-928-J05]
MMKDTNRFMTMDVDVEIEKRRNQSKEFRDAWDSSREEYRLIGEMVKLRKTESITQKELAERTGNKQQSLSRIEKRLVSPSLRTFTNILDALGYRISIEKKK